MRNAKLNVFGSIPLQYQVKEPLKFYGINPATATANTVNTATDDAANNNTAPDIVDQFTQKDTTDGVINAISDRRHKDRIADKFTQKPHHVENAQTRLFLIVFSLFIQALTISVSYIAAFTLFSPLMPELFATALSLLSLGFLEFGKRFSIIPFAKHFIKYRRLQYFNLFVASCCLSASLYLTYTGSIDSVFSLTAKPTEISTESVTANDRADIADLKEHIKRVSKNYSWRNKLTEQGRAEISKLNNQLAVIQARVSEATTRTNKMNDDTRGEHLTRTTGKANTLKYATVFLDLFLVAILFYLEYFDFLSYLHLSELQRKAESEKKKNGSSNSAQIPAQPVRNALNALPINNNATRQQIGFKTYNAQQTAQPVRNALNAMSTPSATRNVVILNCEHCCTEFERKTTWQKYCSEACKISAYEKRTGKKFKKRPSITTTAPIIFAFVFSALFFGSCSKPPGHEAPAQSKMIAFDESGKYFFLTKHDSIDKIRLKKIRVLESMIKKMSYNNDSLKKINSH